MVLVNFISLTAMTEWAERLLWYDDDRFAKHPYGLFQICCPHCENAQNAVEKSIYIIKQILGDNHFTVI